MVALHSISQSGNPANPRKACVVGGGPAGSVAAALLARAGWAVTLFDRHPGARAKCCGECLVPRAVGWLRELGFGEALARAQAGSTRAVRMIDARHHAATGPLWTHSFAGGPGAIVPRASFDAALRSVAAAAGVQLRLGFGVRLLNAGDHLRPATVRITPLAPVSPEQGELSEETETFDLVVAADGVGSATARTAGLARPASAGGRMGWSFTFAPGESGAIMGTHATAEHTLAPPHTIDLILFGSAYLGLVRRGSSVHAAGIVDRRSGWPATPNEALAMMARRSPQLAQFLESQSTPILEAACGPLPWKPLGQVAGRVALVGDAAGYAEPFTGEGMGWGIEGAMIVGNSFRDGWTPRGAQEYQTRWQHEIGSAQLRTLRMGMLLRGGVVAAQVTRAAVRMAPWAARHAASRVVGA